MQKLIVIQLKATAAEAHGIPEEYLSDYLAAGWRVVSLSTAGAGQEIYRSFLITVVLEK
jgi:hypothetical protein